MNRRLVVFLGGTSLVAGALVAAACGSDSTTTSSGSLPTVEAGKDTGGNPPNPPVSPPPTPPDTDGGDSGCSATGPKLRDNTNGFFCPFISKDAGADANPGFDGGDNRYCTNTETCCNPGKDPGGKFPESYCAGPTVTKGGNGETACSAYATANGFNYIGQTDGGSSWECNDKNNCTGGGVCCMTGAGVNVGLTTDPAGKACGFQQAFKFNGTKCEPGPNCAAGEIKLCSTSDMNCGGGTCTPFTALSRDLGYCK